LHARCGLGSDAFNPRDSSLGDTAYLREMNDRCGWRGFVAAYNAGPERYRQSFVDGRPLPRETRNYIAKLLPQIGLAAVDGTTTEVAPPLDWPEAPLFVGRSRRNPTANPPQRNLGSFATSATLSALDARSNEAHSDDVFCVQTRDEQTQ
jgi:Transglycosylase SLT domain